MPRHRECAAEVGIGDGRGREDVVTSRLHTVGHPVHQVGEGRLLFSDGEPAVIVVADGPLHEEVRRPLRCRAHRVDLLHQQWYEQVADGVDAQHRDAEVREDRWDVGQPVRVATLRVLRHAKYRRIEHDLVRRQRRVRVDLIDRRAVVLYVAGCDPDVPSRDADREEEVAPRGERGRERGPGAAGDVLRHPAQLQALGVEHEGVSRTERDLDARNHRRLMVRGERELRLHARQRLGNEVEVEEIVEQLVVPHHAAHRERSDVDVGVLLDGDPCDMPAHRVPGDVRPLRVADQAVEERAEPVRVLHALLHVVAVRAVARRRPRIAVRY